MDFLPPQNTQQAKRFVAATPMWLRVLSVVSLISIAVIGIAVMLLAHFGPVREAHYIDTTQDQAVRLTSGELYVGTIKSITPTYIELQDAYYVNPVQTNAGTAASTSSDTLSAGNIACQLPVNGDQVLINRTQVAFWENVPRDGAVDKAIAQWKSQTASGTRCAQTSSQVTPTTTGTATTSTTTKK
jgi:hypothetical protein